MHNVSALLNSMDPSPVNEKDLNAEAEAFIVAWAKEYPISTTLSLRIHVKLSPTTVPSPWCDKL